MVKRQNKSRMMVIGFSDGVLFSMETTDRPDHRQSTVTTRAKWEGTMWEAERAGQPWDSYSWNTHEYTHGRKMRRAKVGVGEGVEEGGRAKGGTRLKWIGEGD